MLSAATFRGKRRRASQEYIGSPMRASANAQQIAGRKGSTIREQR